MRISVAASHVEPIDMRLHGGWGSVAAPPLASDAAQDDGETLCCAVSGAAADGSGDVIALVDSAEPSPSVEARRALCFSKPRSLSHVAAAQLPILVLTAAAALHSVGLPPRHAFHQHASRPWRCHRPRRERRALLFRSNCVTMSPFDIGKKSEGGLCVFVSCGSVS